MQLGQVILMLSHICLYSVQVLIAACGPLGPSGPEASNQASLRPPDAVDYSLCGSTTARRRIDEYFDQLARFLASGDKIGLRNLVAEKVVIVEGDRSRTVSASIVVEARPSTISMEDWREISRRGEPRLVSAGWRGCFLSNGKAFFEVGENGYLRLVSFNVTMAWDGDIPPR
jgi:hypothetical protein